MEDEGKDEVAALRAEFAAVVVGLRDQAASLEQPSGAGRMRLSGCVALLWPSTRTKMSCGRACSRRSCRRRNSGYMDMSLISGALMLVINAGTF